LNETPPPASSPPSASPPPPTVGWQSPEPEVGPAPGVEFAPHGGRLVAYIIDSIIIGFIITLLLVIGSVVLVGGSTVVDGRVTSVSAGATGVFLLLLLLSTLIGFFYFPFFWARGGQTPGMRPFSLRVVKDSDGTRIGWGTAILRLIGMWVAVAVLYIGLIWIFVDKRRRGWQDLIAGTVVVKRP
jgi:uncharacterized RDD family membrane protein YckC